MPPALQPETCVQFVQENPKRKGSKAHDRYEKYRVAKTVAEALTLGAAKGDLENDRKAGYLTIVSAENAGVPAVGKSPKSQNNKKRPLSDCNAGAGAQQKEVCSPKVAKEKTAAPSPAKRAKVEAAADSNAAAKEDAEMKMRDEVVREADKAAAACAEKGASDNLQLPPVLSAAEKAAQPKEPEACPVKSESQVALADLAGQSPAVPASSSSSKPGEEVDLSFATFEGKNIKYIKRMMGEAKRLLCTKGLEDAKNLKYEFTILDRHNLSKWKVRLSDLNPDGKLSKQLTEKGIDKSIDLEISIPDDYPLAPPFVRVVYPNLAGGFIFSHGGICFELLTKKGWAPSFTLPAVATAVQGIMDSGDVQVRHGGDPRSRTVPNFTEKGAREDARHINSVHRDGDDKTYGSRKMNS